MKKYNVQNYVRLKEDLKKSIEHIAITDFNYNEISRDELVIKFMPFV